MSNSSLPSFIKIHQAVLEKKLKMWKFTDGRRTTDGRTDDGRTDDGRCAMTIAHLSLWLRWAKNRPILVAFYDAHGDTEDVLSSYIPGSPRRNCKQRVKEKWSKDYLPRYWIWFCFVFGGFVCFVLFLCCGSEYLPNPSFKENRPALHVIQNILYQVYILMFLEFKIAFAIL